MTDIRQWLEELGLGQYADAFEVEQIDLDAARHLTDDVLKDLGLPTGPRLKLLAAIKRLNAAKGVDAQANTDTEETVTPSAAPEGERRQLTVLFCDMVGSTALSEKLDPEELRDVMRAYQDACAAAIQGYDGHIAQTLGDGLMVYFGYPVAHEDDPQRSIRAGLDIVSRVAALQADIAVRVGIHTGLVVAGEVGGADTRGNMAVVGETPNVAARLQGLAQSGTVVVGERTRRLAGDVFDYADLGARDLKGLSEPMPVFRVTAERAAESRFQATHRSGLTPFVGRDEEIGLLLRRWEEAKDGDGQVVLLSGEPGIGKSRVTDTFRERIADDAHTRVQYQCSPFYANSAFYPIVTQLERAANFDNVADPDAKLDKLEALLGQTGDEAGEAVTLLAAMMSLPIDRYPSLNMSPQKQKQRTIEVLIERLAELAKSKPVLIVFEDVHWIDPTTLEALDNLIAAVPQTRVFLLITFRPEFTPHWGSHSHISAYTLNRLGRRVSSTLVSKAAGDKPLPVELTDHIVAKTDGVPLFIEELTKAVIESDIVVDRGDSYALSGAIDATAIPDTLHDSLMARLDRLIPVKEVAQIGAAIGREFNYRLVVALSPMSEPDLNAALDKLINSELVYRRGTPPDATYTFKHALVQDAAYESLLKRDRQALHEEIAKVLDENFPATVENEPELLAHHYTEAGLTEPAIDYWLKAGEQAQRRAANVEAINHVTRGLALLEALPQSVARDRRELALQLALCPALMAARGQGTPEMRLAYSRARVLGEQLGDTREHFRALWGLWRSHFVLSERDAAHEFAVQCLEVAEQSGDDAFRIVARFALGGTQFMLGGDFAEARRNLEGAIALYDVKKHGTLAFLYGVDPGPSSQSYLGWLQCLAGTPEKGIMTARAALDLAKASNHSFTAAMVQMYLVVTYLFCRDWPNVLSESAAAINQAESLGMPQVYTLCGTIHGRALVEHGDVEQGISLMERGIAQRKAIDVRISQLVELACLAGGYGKAGRIDDGLAVLAEALEYADQTGEDFYLPELHRLKGDFLLIQDAAGVDAERCYRDAIGVAQRQGAHLLSLRAATDLARLWLEQGRTREAQNLLSPIYECFTEGFDTADLKDAKALLDELK